MLRALPVVLIALVGLCIAVSLYGRQHWATKTHTLLTRLEAERRPLTPAHYESNELAELPAPVQRYFRFALRDGQPIVTRVRIRHEGSFAVNLDAGQWVRFASDQHVVTHRPGFVWDARMAMAPGVIVFVHDAYVAGEGILNPTILGLFDIQDLRGEGEVARGELMRFLAEAAWYPTALLSSQGVTWTAIDETHAAATLVDGERAVTLTFTFNPSGAIESVRAEARGFTKGDEIIQLPWEGRWSDYAERDGMRVPLTGEVAWLMPDGHKPYWRGRVTDIAYEYAEVVP